MKAVFLPPEDLACGVFKKNGKSLEDDVPIFNLFFLIYWSILEVPFSNTLRIWITQLQLLQNAVKQAAILQTFKIENK